MAEIVDLDDQRPHYAIMDLDGRMHVIPVALVDNWIGGSVPFDDDVVKAILKDWQAFMVGPYG